MLFQSRLLLGLGFSHAFPARDVVDEELRAFFSGVPILQVKQVHGSRVVEADAAIGMEADAIVARGKVAGVAVGVRVADCVPILIADPRTGDVVAIHAGWRGVVAKIVPSAVAALQRGSLVAAIGPCIGACCFEVGRDVAALIAAACDGPSALSVRPSIAQSDHAMAGDDKAYVDLRGAVRSQLVSAGLSPARIEDVDGCTKHEAARFHSYRRDGAGSGRMLAAIATRR